MANLKISQLTSGNPAQGGDLIPIDRAGSNFAITAASIATLASSPVSSVFGRTGAVLAVAGDYTWDQIGNAAASLTLSNAAFSTTINQTSSSAALTYANSTAATLAVGITSPLLTIGGRYFGAASGVLATDSPDTWTIQNVVTNGTQNTGTAQITNIAESAGNVVTITLATPTSPTAAGQVWIFTGLSSGAWLNGYAVTLISGNASICTFNDPTGHGLLNSVALTGTPVMTRADNLSTLAIVHHGSGLQGTSGLVTSLVGVSFSGSTPATSTLSQLSPTIFLTGNYWNGAASAPDGWSITSVPSNGTNGASTLILQHNGSSGGSSVSVRGAAGASSPTSLAFSNWGIQSTPAAIGTGIALQLLASGWSGAVISSSTIGPYGTVLGNSVNFTNATQTTVGCQYGAAFGTVATGASLISAPTAGATKFYGAAANLTINQTASATGDYCGLMVNVTEQAFLGTNANLFEAQLSCPITNITETVGNVVTLVVTNNTAVSGQVVQLEGLTTGTWLNGFNVTLSAGTNATTLVFTDPTSHGTQASHAEVGRASLTQLSISKVGVATKYKGISTVRNGIAAEYASSDLTAQSAAIGATTLLSAPQTGAYKVSWSATITTADGVSSVLGGTGGFQVIYTSPTDSVVKTTVAGNSVTSSANTTGTAVGGVEVIYAKTGTNIQFQYGYTSGTPGQMVYELHISVEAL